MSYFLLTCPECHSRQITRSKSRSIRDRVRKRFSSKRLFRCHACRWRGWLVPAQPHRSHREWELESEPPHMAELDAQFPVLHRSVVAEEPGR